MLIMLKNILDPYALKLIKLIACINFLLQARYTDFATSLNLFDVLIKTSFLSSFYCVLTYIIHTILVYTVFLYYFKFDVN